VKKRKVWRYTCEFCGKSNCSASAMSTHERHCTKNPKRVCRMCQRVGDEQRPMAELIAAIRYTPIPGCEEYQIIDLGDGVKVGSPRQFARDIGELRRISHNCPACILAALRQVTEPADELVTNDDGFVWKNESKAWIDDYRRAILTDWSSDGVFDRGEWDEARAKRFGEGKSP